MDEKKVEMTPEQRTLLIRRRLYLFGALTEEAGEVSQCVGKILRFGEADFHPKTDNVPNIQLLHEELNDLFGVAMLLGWSPDQESVRLKQAKVEKYFKYAQNGGSRGADTGGESKGQGEEAPEGA